MNTKFISLQTRITCLSKQRRKEKDIFAQIEKTIAVRNRNIQRLEDIRNMAKITDLYLDKKAAV